MRHTRSIALWNLHQQGVFHRRRSTVHSMSVETKDDFVATRVSTCTDDLESATTAAPDDTQLRPNAHAPLESLTQDNNCTLSRPTDRSLPPDSKAPWIPRVRPAVTPTAQDTSFRSGSQLHGGYVQEEIPTSQCEEPPVAAGHSWITID